MRVSEQVDGEEEGGRRPENHRRTITVTFPPPLGNPVLSGGEKTLHDQWQPF